MNEGTKSCDIFQYTTHTRRGGRVDWILGKPSKSLKILHIDASLTPSLCHFKYEERTNQDK